MKNSRHPVPSVLLSATVIRECVYGVDLNPLAVELCKVALWLEAHTPGEPLNFLDHHIKCGNAIVGFARREEAERGVPDLEAVRERLRQLEIDQNREELRLNSDRVELGRFRKSLEYEKSLFEMDNSCKARKNAIAMGYFSIA